MKEATIRSVWAKCGMILYNPSIVLSKLKDPLTFAMGDNKEVLRKKKGYIDDEKD